MNPIKRITAVNGTIISMYFGFLMVWPEVFSAVRQIPGRAKYNELHMRIETNGIANKDIIPSALPLSDHASGVAPVKCVGIVSGRNENMMSVITNGMKAMIKPDLRITFDMYAIYNIH